MEEGNVKVFSKDSGEQVGGGWGGERSQEKGCFSFCMMKWQHIYMPMGII